MAHTCPRCGQYCDCRGDWDDIDFGEDWNCECDCEEPEGEGEDVDNEWDEEVEEAFKQSQKIKEALLQSL